VNRFVFIGGLLIVGVLTLAAPQNQPDDIKCEIVSVRIMSEKESTTIAGPDFIGADVLVRFRLSTSNRNIFFYGYNYNKKPGGHRTKWSDQGKMKVCPLGVKVCDDFSPGLRDLLALGLPMSWIPLNAGKTIEFEILDGTGSAGEKHGATVFVRLSPTDLPMEIFSDPYVVPVRPK
jgi:hypothetical protein